LFLPSGDATLIVSWAITEEAVSATNRAANVIPRVQLGTYIFISFSVCEVGETWRVAIRECENADRAPKQRKQ
jgi:hypothetical protein